MSEKNLKITYGIGFFIILPLIMTQGYSNITITKYTTLGLLTISVFFWMVLLRFLENTENNGYVGKLIKKNVKNRWDIVCFVIFNIITCILSGNIAGDIVASNDKHMGLFLVAIMLMVYCTVKYTKYEEKDKKILQNIISIGIVSVVVIALLQFMGVDFGNMLGRLDIAERGNFLSTFGNTAVFAKYCCIIFPMILYYMENKIWYIVLSALFPISVIISNTDAAFIALVACVVLYMIISLFQHDQRKFWIGIESGLGGLTAFGIICNLIKDHRHLSAIGKLVISFKTVEAIVFIIILVILLMHQKYKWVPSDKMCNIIGIIITILSVIVIITGVAAIIYYSVINRTAKLGKMENYIRFSDSWGTDRGYVWRWCTEIFSGFSVKSKLFGAGHGSVPGLLLNNYGDVMETELGYYFDNAHSMYLHQLLSIGIIGIGSYLVILIKSIVRGLKNKMATGFAVSLIIYGIMSIVCIYEPISEPYIWVIIGAIDVLILS